MLPTRTGEPTPIPSVRTNCFETYEEALKITLVLGNLSQRTKWKAAREAKEVKMEDR